MYKLFLFTVGLFFGARGHADFWKACLADMKAMHVDGTVSTNFMSQTQAFGEATGELSGQVGHKIVASPTEDPIGTLTFLINTQWKTSKGSIHTRCAAVVTSVADATSSPGALYAIKSYPLAVVGGTGKFKGAFGEMHHIGVMDLRDTLHGKNVFRYIGDLCIKK